MRDAVIVLILRVKLEWRDGGGIGICEQVGLLTTPAAPAWSRPGGVHYNMPGQVLAPWANDTRPLPLNVALYCCFKRGRRVRIQWGRYRDLTGVVDRAVFHKTVDLTSSPMVTTWP